VQKGVETRFHTKKMFENTVPNPLQPSTLTIDKLRHKLYFIARRV